MVTNSATEEPEEPIGVIGRIGGEFTTIYREVQNAATSKGTVPWTAFLCYVTIAVVLGLAGPIGIIGYVALLILLIREAS